MKNSDFFLYLKIKRSFFKNSSCFLLKNNYILLHKGNSFYSRFLEMDLNKVMLIGRSTNTLQVKTIESTQSSVVNFTLATNKKYKNKDGNILEDAEYHRCVAYGNTAEILGKYLTKGKKIYLEGRLRTRKWQDSEGHDRFSTEIIVDNFIFLDSKVANTDEVELESGGFSFDDEVPF